MKTTEDQIGIYYFHFSHTPCNCLLLYNCHHEFTCKNNKLCLCACATIFAVNRIPFESSDKLCKVMADAPPNPFSDLIADQPSDVATAVPPIISAAPPAATANKSQINVFDQKVNALIEQVFLITVNKTPPRQNKQFVYMEEIGPLCTNSLLTVDLLEQALFERILLPNPADFVLPNNIKTDELNAVCETRVITYLYESYARNEQCLRGQDTICMDTCTRIHELIMRNIATAIKQPVLFEGQQFAVQLLDILKTSEDFHIKGAFLSTIVKEVLLDNEPADMDALKLVIYPMLMEILKKLQSATLISLETWICPVLKLFVDDKSNGALANLLLEFSTPRAPVDGIKYADTIFGQLLRISILPKNQNGPYEYFNNVAAAEMASQRQSLWNYLKLHLDAVTALFKGFLLCGGETKNGILAWIGQCLHANAARGQLWNSHNPAAGMFGSMKTVPDSFALGLAGVLLRLCQPLLKPQLKVLLVDPTYCATVAADRSERGVHMIDADKETCLIPTEEGERRLVADNYNFVTECFFMTHKAIDLGEFLFDIYFMQPYFKFENTET